MRISFVIPGDGMTGGIRVVSIYADKLARRGHEVVVIAPGPRRTPIQGKIKSLVSGRGWPSDVEQEPSYFDTLSTKVRTVESHRPIVDADLPDADVVISTWWETAEWVAALSNRKGAKVYLIQHHEVFSHLPVERAKATYRLPLHKIVISRWLKRIMQEEYNDNRVELIPNSVDSTHFFSEERRKQAVSCVGFVYSSVQFKGSDIILKALHEVRQKLPELRVIAFGAEQPSSKLPLPDWVTYHYRPPQEKIRQLYSSCDVWLCGSRSEGFYLPMLEAMACRCPVVSTRVGGAIDIIEDSTNGFVVDVEDVIALADRTLRVLSLSDDKWNDMSGAARATATQYSWDDATDKMEAVLNKLVRSPNREGSGFQGGARNQAV